MSWLFFFSGGSDAGPSVALNTPANGDTTADTTPTLEFTGTDPQAHDLRYQVQLDTVATFDSTAANIALATTYEIANRATSLGVTGTFLGMGVGVVGNGKAITSARFNLIKTGSPTGNMYAKLYAVSGGLPATLVATSNAVDAATAPAGSTTSWQEFVFTGNQRFVMENGVSYILTYEYPTAAGSIGFNVGVDNSAPAYAGSFVRQDSSSVWSDLSATYDLIFELYTGTVAPLLDKTSQLNVTTTETFTASGSWVAPAGVTSVTIEAWGGGGGGGGASTDSGGGGGGGAYSKKNTFAVTPGNSYTVTVGAGGAGVIDADGVAGGDSWFNSTATVLAKGGGPGRAAISSAGGAGGSTASGVGDVLFAGGNGAAGGSVGTASGGGGGGAGNAAAGGNASGTTAGTGGSAGGGAGGAGRTTNGDGAVGSILGGGGSGAFDDSITNRTGGAGARGELRITYTAVSGDAGFVNTVDGADTSPFTSGQKVSHTVQSALAEGTYHWRVRATDPAGANEYGAWSAIRTLTVGTAPALSNAVRSGFMSFFD